jgi:uncharacterized secreted protein with C-terminal beta-propeller domain
MEKTEGFRQTWRASGKQMERALVFGIAILAVAFLLVGCISGPGGVVTPPIISPPTEASELKSFSSWNEIYSFLDSANSGSGYYGGRGMLESIAMAPGAFPTMATGVKSADATQSASDYSQTNVQVAGVDEADIVKNDGKYIYVATGNQYGYYRGGGSGASGSVAILDAFPAEQMRKISQIDITGSVSNIYIYKDKLVVFGSEYKQEEYPPMPPDCDECLRIVPPNYGSNYAFMRVYDVTDRTSPKLEKEYEMKGNYQDSRMIAGKVYAIFQDYAYRDYPIPIMRVDGVAQAIAPSEVRFFDEPDSGYNYNTFLGVDLNDLGKGESRKIMLMGNSQNLYVSQENMYVTYTKYTYYQPIWPVYDKVYGSYLPFDVQQNIAAVDAQEISDWRKERLKAAEVDKFLSDDINPIAIAERTVLSQNFNDEAQKARENILENEEKTVVHKVALDGAFTYLGKGEVPGHVLNQFSMDEHNGYFRVATTVGELNRWWGVRGNQNDVQVSTNGVYVLDKSLSEVGRLEGLAPNEKIYSARFMGDRAYLVTFKKVDPLFVLDLAEPTNPKVLGKLKIPGYSDYLHPYDENHIIGLGKGAIAAEEGDFAWYQGVKLSLFDVSDVEHPKEVAKYEIGDRGTDSYALSDHRAFLFSKERNLLVIPVKLAEIDESKYPGGVEANTYGDYVFQGAYVFDISPEGGFVLRGSITHADAEDFARSGEYYYGSGNDVMRSLYMDNYLYTVSGKYVKANDLGTLDEVSSVQIAEPEKPKYENYG